VAKLAKGKALVVGINSYKDCPLNCCINDAEEISNILRFPEYDYDVIMHLDNHACRDNIVESLVNLFHDSVENRILFYFSGHGFSTKFGNFLVTHDHKFYEPGIELSFLSKLISSSNNSGRNILIILDCCHAGAIQLKTSYISYLSNNNLKSSFSALPEGSAILAACRFNETTAEDISVGHGIFTWYILEGLLGKAANENGDVTALSLHDYISRSMLSKGESTPIFRGDLAGYLVLGTGFEPISRTVFDISKKDKIITEGNSHLDDFQGTISPYITNRQLWSESGYKIACQSFTPVVNWLERKEIEFPELRDISEFKRLISEVRSWQRRLSTVEGVVNTPWGQVVELIGGGTFGSVWKIKRDGSFFAYKIYHGNDLNLLDKLVRFRRGYEAMKKLDHPHIIKVTEFTNCPIGFFMEYIDGPNLRAFAGGLEEKDQLMVLLTIAETLAHAHGRGVRHRDVKPENIVMRYDSGRWYPYLTDFDLAWFSTASVVTKEAIGSAYYAAPEQIYKPGSSAARDVKVDIYSFGQLCFYSFTKTDPVPQANNSIVLGKQLQGWKIGDAANDILKLYNSTTQADTRKRLGDFRVICDILHRAIALSGGSQDDEVDKERFLRETKFGLVGFDVEYESADSFTTLSGYNHIDIEVLSTYSVNISLKFHISRLVELRMPGLGNAEVRRRINIRIDEILNNYKFTKRHAGGAGIFETYINIYDLPLTIRGVLICRKIISRVIEAIEKDN
jgi:serine/threonine protein kinase